MAQSRGEANQALYRARIVLEAWDRARGHGVSEEQLLGAFLPAVRLHLHRAYGCFLLAVSGADESGAVPLPRCVADMPAPEAGRALAPELAEFAGLERAGWLAEMLDKESAPVAVAAASPEGGLIGSDRLAPGYAVARNWCDRLADTMARMDDSLNEC